MVKIPLAKNRLAIDHRAPQTDRNVSHEANPEAQVNSLPVRGAGLQTWSSGLAPVHPMGPHRVEWVPVAHPKPCLLYFCWPFASSFSFRFSD